MKKMKKKKNIIRMIRNFKIRPLTISNIYIYQVIYGFFGILISITRKGNLLYDIAYYSCMVATLILLLILLFKNENIEVPDELMMDNIKRSCTLTFILLILILAVFSCISDMIYHVTIDLRFNIFGLTLSVVIIIQGLLMLFFEKRNVGEEDE